VLWLTLELRATLLASGGPELVKLAGEVSGVGRDAGAAENHAGDLHQKSASKERNSIGILVLTQIS